MIGIKKIGVWLPENFESAGEISSKSGIPEKVIKEKMGIIRKCRAPRNIMPSFMAIEAAKKVLKDEDPLSIDMIIWTGSEYKDHIVWSAGIFVQEALGLRNAFAFDVAARCSSNVVGLKIAKDMMNSNSKINKVLLCGGHKTGDLVNYRDENSRFLYNLSDGGSAILLEKNVGNELGEASIITDGSFSKDVIIPAGGVEKPLNEYYRDEDRFLCVPDVIGMRNRLAEKSLSNFIHVIKEAATQTCTRPIDYLALLHMKRSAHDEILNRLELKEEQSIYLDQFGHFGAPDQVLSLALAEQNELLQKGDHIVLASAGIGYTWSAISVTWSEKCSVEKIIY
ncbi:MAG: 3-oxoacyl-ACP synthase [Halobacteriovoraceae bacterium]|nr:3-oxoacyl-ACP synthase [Halobacteriovoraceae bacterium]